MPDNNKKNHSFNDLIAIVSRLRSPDGCPWDRQQNHRSLTRYVIEESYELVDAIEKGKDQEIASELGDVLFQVLLHSQIAQDEGRFSLTDVVENLASKLVRRHPHVFGSLKMDDVETIKRHWAEIKEAERAANPTRENDFFSIPHLPALARAQKIGERTRELAFDWTHPDPVLEKVSEELEELKETMSQDSAPDRRRHEIGDLLFSVVQLARHLDIEAEQALREANNRFIERFNKMQELVAEKNQNWGDLTSEEKEACWQTAKKLL